MEIWWKIEKKEKFAVRLKKITLDKNLIECTISYTLSTEKKLV